ncbi:Variable surface protein Vir7-like protein [Plasmodium coatneyi]|uniref:Variable surface protein Vir7-like protein n=1 Tax=Plasmodium coatneyi TaxID=208452 RepID=A0A1B1DY20_9APIC|nr:Variable surface protein Vir7-like protein [Plasmodium coatneyi]ANQ07519.1 Variable surface protein Vir7-like protein [Plasmodium coatneyi]
MKLPAAVLSEGDRQKLTSYINFYSKFENSDKSCTCGDDAAKGRLKNGLEEETEVQGCADIIANAACCLSPQNSYSWPTDGKCHFLYFWVGDILLNTCKVTSSLGTIIGKVLHELKKWSELGCTDYKYNSNMDKTIFLNRKAVFDYFVDCGDIKSFIFSNKPKCAAKYGPYLEAIIPIYEDVKRDCEGVSATDPYCEYIKAVFEDNYDPVVLKLQCGTVLRAEGAASSQLVLQSRFVPAPRTEDHGRGDPLSSHSSTTSNGGNGNGATTTAVTGTLGTISLTTLTYLLYKYTSLPSWIRRNTSFFGRNAGRNNNSSSNRSRRKKRRTSNQDFDDLTETSTIGGSTMGSTTDDSNTLYSVPYTTTRPSTRRARSTEQRGRKNVAYHPT